uniref:Uncharacterized protein n=1 Tax=Denticeps clupeoides TaxID=299321 RepID=A0AAY4C2V6_9TELE
MSTLILDNGAYLAKMCYSHAMLSCCKHKGTVLLHTVHLLCILRSFYFLVDFADTSIVITEPYFNFTSTQESMSEILLEEYHAHRYFCENSSDLCCIVVGRSFSFTHIVPYCRGGKMKDGICMSVLVLTGCVRLQPHDMDETHVMNQVKKDVWTWTWRQQSKCISLDQTRIPSGFRCNLDIGIQEMVIPEALISSIRRWKTFSMQHHFFKNHCAHSGQCPVPGVPGLCLPGGSCPHEAIPLDYEENGHYICEEKTADIGHTNALTDS